MTTLYELTAEYRDLIELLDEEGEGADESIEQALSQIEGDIKVKSENIAKVWHELNAKAEARRKEANRLRDRAAVAERAAQRIRKYLLEAMMAVKAKAVEWDTGSVSVCRNGGAAPIEVTDDLPDEYMKTHMTIEPDLDKIRTALKSGEQVDGVIVKERSHHIRIK